MTVAEKVDCGYDTKILYMCAAHEVFPGKTGNPSQADGTLLGHVHKLTYKVMLVKSGTHSYA